MKIGFSIWGIKLDDIRSILDIVAEAGYHGVEFVQRPDALGVTDIQELSTLLAERNMTFTQEVQSIGDHDLPNLAKELGKLYAEMQKQAKEPEHHLATGAIGLAEAEAKEGNKSKALEYLKQAGQWALDVATQIGVRVAAAAIKESLGMK